MLVMTVPMGLLLRQVALRYQTRPLRVAEEAVVTVWMNQGPEDLPAEVQLTPTAVNATTLGPVRVASKDMVCWKIAARQAGCRQLEFVTRGPTCAKELAVGDGFMRVSSRRRAWLWSEVLRHPREQPLSRDAPIRAIE